MTLALQDTETNGINRDVTNTWRIMRIPFDSTVKQFSPIMEFITT